MPNKREHRDILRTTELFVFDEGAVFDSRLGDIVSKGVLDQSLKYPWRTLRTFEHRRLAAAALHFGASIDAFPVNLMPESCRELADTIMQTTVVRILSNDERVAVAHAVDVLAAADPEKLSGDAELGSYIGFIAPAMYACGYRLPTQL